MREINTKATSDSSSSFWTWRSPLPYLFGSLAIMLVLIVVALIVLACSFHKRLSSSATSSEKSARPAPKIIVEMSPRVVVIMAGDQKPSHIGVPISSSSDYKPSDSAL
nr:protein GLUTAMINE DUMPER 5-like [Nicotiana tomentosiformis]